MLQPAVALLRDRIGPADWQVVGIFPDLLEAEMRIEAAMSPAADVDRAAVFTALLENVASPPSFDDALHIYLERGELAAAENMRSVLDAAREQGKARGGGIESRIRQHRQDWEERFNLQFANTQSVMDFVRATTSDDHIAGITERIARAVETASTLSRYGLAIKELEATEAHLREVLDERRDQLASGLTEVEAHLTSGTVDGTVRTTAAPILAACRSAIRSGRLELAEEALVWLRDAMAGKVDHDRWRYIRDGAAETAQSLPEVHGMLAVAQSTERTDLRDYLSGKKNVPPPWARISELPKADREEADALLGELYEIARAGRPRRLDLVTSFIESVSNFLGIHRIGDELEQLDEAISAVRTRVMLNEDGGRRIPLPCFGRESEVDGFDLVIAWPGVSLANPPIRMLPMVPQLVIYLAQASDSEREILAECAWLLIDEVILKCLAAHPAPRTYAAFSLTVPRANRKRLSPYTAHGAVCPEMFYDRKSLLEDILKPGGLRLIYGGRMVGKSSLLKEACRQEMRSATRTLSAYCDVGPSESAVDVWDTMLEALRRVWPADDEGKFPDDLFEAIDRAVKRGYRLAFYLDEADELVRSDEAHDWLIGKQLRKCVSDSDSRVAFVLAGFQHLHRALRPQDSPYRNLQPSVEPRPVGPLDAAEALQLVVETLAMFGCYFETESVARRIVTYAAGYPNLIQAFCRSLLLDKAPREGGPPFMITDSHVDRAYADAEVPKVMARTFADNIERDDRYKAIFYGLLSTRENSLTDGLLNSDFTVSEAAEAASEWIPHEHWSYDMTGELLEELQALGVVTCVAAGTRGVEDTLYRITSEHFARVLLRYVDIDEELLKLQER